MHVNWGGIMLALLYGKSILYKLIKRVIFLWSLIDKKADLLVKFNSTLISDHFITWNT